MSPRQVEEVVQRYPPPFMCFHTNIPCPSPSSFKCVFIPPHFYGGSVSFLAPADTHRHYTNAVAHAKESAIERDRKHNWSPPVRRLQAAELEAHLGNMVCAGTHPQTKPSHS